MQNQQIVRPEKGTKEHCSLFKPLNPDEFYAFLICIFPLKTGFNSNALSFILLIASLAMKKYMKKLSLRGNAVQQWFLVTLSERYFTQLV